MLDTTLPPALEPAFTPAFLAYLEAISHQRHRVVLGGAAWTTFIYRAIQNRAPASADTSPRRRPGSETIV
jgi:hypothetical protein